MNYFYQSTFASTKIDNPMFPVHMSPEWLYVNELMFEDFRTDNVVSSKTYDELRANINHFIANYKKHVRDLTDSIHKCKEFEIKKFMSPPYIPDVLMYIRYSVDSCDWFIDKSKKLTTFDELRSSFDNLINTLNNYRVKYHSCYTDFCYVVLFDQPYKHLNNIYKSLIESYDKNNKQHNIKAIVDHCFDVVQFVNWTLNSTIVKLTHANKYIRNDIQQYIDNALLELSFVRRMINEQTFDIDSIRNRIMNIMDEFDKKCGV